MKKSKLEYHTFKTLKFWLMYYNVHTPSINDIMNIDSILMATTNKKVLQRYFVVLNLPFTHSATVPSTQSTIKPNTSTITSYTKLPPSAKKLNYIDNIGVLKYSMFNL